ncbi:MAG: hypothetical protein FWJ90_15520 [Actinomadura sp.]
MKGRHRGQPKAGSAGDEAGERPPGRWRIGAVAVSAALLLTAAVIVFGLRGEPATREPQTADTSAQEVAPTPGIPEEGPTYGEYVPPDATPEAATKAPPPKPAPTPRAAPSKTNASPTPGRAWPRRTCPPEWREHWWMRRWCHGPRDPDGHRAR